MAQSLVGARLPRAEAVAEAGRIRAFARAIGDLRPVCHDPAAARAAGYRGLLAPPTFLFALEMLDRPEPMPLLAQSGIDMNRVLHGEQRFDYGQPVCAGDVVVFETRIVDDYEKAGGRLRLIVSLTEARHADGVDAGRATSTLVVKAP